MISQSLITGTLLKYAGVGKSKYLSSPQNIFDSLKSETVIFFDTETTGLYAGVHQITELAAVAVKGDSFTPIDKFHKKMKLTEATKARSQCEKMEGLQGLKRKDKSVEDCLTLQKYDPSDPSLQENDQTLKDFKLFCDKYNAVMIGQNAKFDMEQVNANLKKIDEGPIRQKGIYDTMLLMKTHVVPALKSLVTRGGAEGERAQQMLQNMTKRGRISYSLESILQAFGLNIEGWHGAFEDVKSTLTAFQIINKLFEKLTDLHTDPTFIENQEKAFNDIRKSKLPGSWEQKSKEHFYNEERSKNRRIQDVKPEDLPY